jgi:hypothetical protein
LFIPREVRNLAGVPPVYEEQLWRPILGILWCLLLPNSVNNTITSLTSTTICHRICESQWPTTSYNPKITSAATHGIFPFHNQANIKQPASASYSTQVGHGSNFSHWWLQ